MTRALLLLALLFTAAAASAQSPAEADPGFYLSVEDVTISAQDFADLDALGTRVEAGRRFGNGLEVGLIGSYARYGRRVTASSRVWSAGLTGGLTRPSVAGTTFRLRGLTALGATDTRFSDDRIETTFLEGDLSATLGREIPVVGSLRVEPMVGAYAHLTNVLHREGTGQFADSPSGGIGTEVGAQLGLAVRARVLGLDVALTPGLRLTGFGPDRLLPRRSFLPVPGTGLRIDF